MMVSRPLRAFLLRVASDLLSLKAVLVFLAAVGFGAGCKGAPAFVCESSDECNPGGTCEGTGFCSFPDEACASGDRYGGYAGDGLSNTCVGETGADGRPDVDGGFFDAPDMPGDARSGGCIDVGGGTCLALPTEEVQSGEAVAADYSCAKYVPGTAAAPVGYSGKLEDPISGTGAAGGTIQWFRDLALTSLVVEATANANGDYVTTLPTGTPSTMQVRITASGKVETLHWNTGHRLNTPTPVSRDWHVYSNANLTSIATGAGATHTPGVDVVYGFTYDCLGEPVRNAIAVLSSTSSVTGELPTVVPGTIPYYDARPRSERTSSDDDGDFYFFGVPAIPAGGARYLQVWGYISRADVARGAYGLTLISELPVPSRAGALIRVEAHHTEGPLN